MIPHEDFTVYMRRALTRIMTVAVTTTPTFQFDWLEETGHDCRSKGFSSNLAIGARVLALSVQRMPSKKCVCVCVCVCGTQVTICLHEDTGKVMTWQVSTNARCTPLHICASTNDVCVAILTASK